MKRKDIMLGRLNELLLPLGYEHITTPGINGFFKVYPDYVDLFTLGFYMRLDIVDIIRPENIDSLLFNMPRQGSPQKI